MVRTSFTTTAALSTDDLERWRQLAVQRPHSAPLVDPAWLLAWTEAFATEATLACARDGDGTLVGVAALYRAAERWGGRRLAVLQSLTNVESFRFDFLSSPDRAGVEEQLWETLCGTAGVDVVRIDHLPEGSPTLRTGLAVARRLGWRAVVQPTFQTPQRPLDAAVPWDHYLTRKFRANLRSRDRRLAALGDVTFEVTSSADAARDAMAIFCRLEASGWKGAVGTAVAQQERVRCLYQDLQRRSPGDVLVALLRVDDRVVAAQILRALDRTVYLLKTAYDPEYAACAPGHLLTAAVIRYATANGFTALDFLADNAPWKAEWAPLLLPHHRLILFAPSLPARYGYWVRYGLRARARAVPGLLGVARWLRGARR